MPGPVDEVDSCHERRSARGRPWHDGGTRIEPLAAHGIARRVAGCPLVGLERRADVESGLVTPP